MKALQRERNKIIIILLLIAAVCIGIVSMNAYSSKLQYEINSLNSQVQESNYKIANLEVKIKSATNVANLEDRALAMGLVYPGFDKIVYVKGSDNMVEDFATALRQKNSHN